MACQPAGPAVPAAEAVTPVAVPEVGEGAPSSPNVRREATRRVTWLRDLGCGGAFAQVRRGSGRQYVPRPLSWLIPLHLHAALSREGGTTP